MRVAAARRRAVGRHGLALQRGDAALLQFEPRDACQGEQHRAAVERGGNRRHQHRLLGIGRAAEATGAEVPAALDVALDRRRGDGEFERTFAQQFVVLVRCGQPRADVEALFGAQEPGRQVVVGELRQAEVLAPVRQRGRGRAKRARPVDGGRATDAAALQDVDRLVGRLAAGRLLVQRRVGLGFELSKVAARLQRAFFDDDELQACRTEQLGGDTRAGAAADDGDVAFNRRRQCAMGAAEHAPAARHAVGDRVWNRSVGFGCVHASALGPG